MLNVHFHNKKEKCMSGTGIQVVRRNWWLLAVRGLLAIILGLIVLFLPGLPFSRLSMYLLHICLLMVLWQWSPLFRNEGCSIVGDGSSLRAFSVLLQGTSLSSIQVSQH